VRVVHGLQGDAGVIAVKVAVLDEILDGIDNLLFVLSSATVVQKSVLKDVGSCQFTFFRMLACSNRASNISIAC
jgi:hypothetical protein